LPCFHKETLAEAEEQLRIVMEAWQTSRPPLPCAVAKLDGSMERWLTQHCPQGDKLLPSVRASLEMALLHLLSRAMGEPLVGSACRTVQNCGSDIGINALVARAEDLSGASEGATVVKVKVGKDPQEDAQRVNRLAETLEALAGPEAHLRLDANQAWTIDEAVEFVGALDDRAQAITEYLEEPVQVPETGRLADAWQELSRRTSGRIPLAVDESLTEGAITLDELEGCASLLKAVLLKPALQGLEKCSGLATWALCRGLRPVVSSAFESGVALSHFAILSSTMLWAPWEAQSNVSASHGLGTYSRLEEDVLCTPFADLVRHTAAGWQVDVLHCRAALDETVDALVKHHTEGFTIASVA
jgi:o-succinylbenzoate synthase